MGEGAQTVIFRQVATTPGTPGGPGYCFDLLQEIVDLLNEVAQRFNDALNDPHGLYEHYSSKATPHPDGHGSWEGHQDRFNYDRGRLRHKLGEWDASDECRGYLLDRQQQEELDEAQEFAGKNFPERPAPTLERSQQEDPAVWDRLRQHLPEILVGALIAVGGFLAASAILACFASGACEFGIVLAGLGVLLVVGIRAVLRAAGVRDEPTLATSDTSLDHDGWTA